MEIVDSIVCSLQFIIELGQIDYKLPQTLKYHTQKSAIGTSSRSNPITGLFVSISKSK